MSLLHPLPLTLSCSSALQLEKEVERARNNYAALNAQLLDELPRLYALSLDVVADSVARLAHAQSRFHSLTVGEMYRLLDVSSQTCSSSARVKTCNFFLRRLAKTSGLRMRQGTKE